MSNMWPSNMHEILDFRNFIEWDLKLDIDLSSFGTTECGSILYWRLYWRISIIETHPRIYRYIIYVQFWIDWLRFIFQSLNPSGYRRIFGFISEKCTTCHFIVPYINAASRFTQLIIPGLQRQSLLREKLTLSSSTTALLTCCFFHCLGSGIPKFNPKPISIPWCYNSFWFLRRPGVIILKKVIGRFMIILAFE